MGDTLGLGTPLTPTAAGDLEREKDAQGEGDREKGGEREGGERQTDRQTDKRQIDRQTENSELRTLLHTDKDFR